MIINMGTLAERVKARRLELKEQKRDGKSWSQGYVAGKIKELLIKSDPDADCSQQAYAAVESGGSKNPAFLLEMAEALYTAVDWLKHGKGYKEALAAPTQAPTAPMAPAAAKSPAQEALALHARILELCAQLSPEAKLRVNVNDLDRDIREALGKQPPKPEAKRGAA